MKQKCLVTYRNVKKKMRRKNLARVVFIIFKIIALCDTVNYQSNNTYFTLLFIF